MSFGWNDNKKVEKMDPLSRQVYQAEATPKFIIKNPHGFRQDDIVHSLALVVSEMVEMAEAQASSQLSILKMKESINAKTEDQAAERDIDNQDAAQHPQSFEETSEERGSLSESSGV